jgi:hypothetical protein
MTTTLNPITPPDELLQEWWKATPVQVLATDPDPPDPIQLIAAKAAQWGADQELEACCHEVQDMYSGGSRLRAARRPAPKPPETIEVDGFTYRLVP